MSQRPDMNAHAQQLLEEARRCDGLANFYRAEAERLREQVAETSLPPRSTRTEGGRRMLTEPQRRMLAFYADRGPTAQSDGVGTLNTWRSLINRGLLRRSNGLGAIETEITEAGLSALQQGGF
jgi:hypothetical protein